MDSVTLWSLTGAWPRVRMGHSTQLVRTMALPQLIPESAIIEREKRYNERHRLMLGTPQYVELTRDKRRLQRDWLSVYQSVLSPTIANRRLGISQGQYEGWRDHDPIFAKMFNETLELIRGELAGAAVGRAIGEAVADDDGNHALDALGRPIYRNGSDRLMVALLGLESKEQSADVMVNIEIVSR